MLKSESDKSLFHSIYLISFLNSNYWEKLIAPTGKSPEVGQENGPFESAAAHDLRTQSGTDLPVIYLKNLLHEVAGRHRRPVARRVVGAFLSKERPR